MARPRHRAERRIRRLAPPRGRAPGGAPAGDGLRRARRFRRGVGVAGRLRRPTDRPRSGQPAAARRHQRSAAPLDRRTGRRSSRRRAEGCSRRPTRNARRSAPSSELASSAQVAAIERDLARSTALAPARERARDTRHALETISAASTPSAPTATLRRALERLSDDRVVRRWSSSSATSRTRAMSHGRCGSAAPKRRPTRASTQRGIDPARRRYVGTATAARHDHRRRAGWGGTLSGRDCAASPTGSRPSGAGSS